MKENVVESNFRFIENRANNLGFYLTLDNDPLYLENPEEYPEYKYRALLWGLARDHFNKIKGKELVELWDDVPVEEVDQDIWFMADEGFGATEEEALEIIKDHLQKWAQRAYDIHIRDKEQLANPSKWRPFTLEPPIEPKS